MKQGRNDMRKALEKLQVNRPLRLPSDGPGLSAPTSKSVWEMPHSEVPPKQVPQFEAAQKDKPPLNEEPRIDSSAERGHQQTSTPNQIEAPLSEKPLKQPPQFDLTQNEHSRTELAQKEGAQDEVTSSAAFFRLSPRVFSESLTRGLSGDCFRLFLWLSWRAWRYPNSPGVVRAAVSFIEQETGMGHATASRALKKLRESGLVELMETDFKRGNLWKVSGLACPNRSPDPGSATKPPRNEAPPKKNAGAPERGASHLKSSGKPPQNESHLKNYINLRSLSQEDANFFFERMDRFSAPKKRERELRHLEALLSRFKSSDLVGAVLYLETKGTLRGESCHSPYSYLAVAADEVFKRVQSGPNGSSVIAESQIAMEPTCESKPVEASLALCSFETQLAPGDQEQYLNVFVAREFPHGYLPPTRVTKSLAAMAWLTERTSHSSSFQLAG